MSEQEHPGVSVPIQHYIDQRLADLERKDEVLRQNMEHRLDGMNEFRAQLSAQQRTFVTRELFDTRTSFVDERVNAINNWRSNMEGRMYVLASIPTVVAVVAGVVAIWAALK